MDSTPVQDDAASKLLGTCPLFRGLPIEQLRAELQTCQHHQYGSNDHIFRRGDRADAFYVIVQGQVEIVIEEPKLEPDRSKGQPPETDDGRKIHRTARVGEWFGEAGCIEEGRLRTADAFVLHRATVLRVPAEQFRRWLRDLPNVASAIIKHLSERLQHHTDLRVRADLDETAKLPGIVDLLREREASLSSAERTWDKFGQKGLWLFSHRLFFGAHIVWWVCHVAVWLWYLFWKNEATAAEACLNSLTMIVSLEAIVLSIFVLVSQNRAEAQATIRNSFHDRAANQNRELALQILQRLDDLETRFPRLSKP